MTDPETVTRAKDSDLSRATQALKDAAMQWSVIKASDITRADRRRILAQTQLHRAAEDYAEAYLRG